MKVITVSVGYLQENAYICYDETSREAAVIDPGGGALDLLDVINANNLTVLYILLTHGHYDHTGAAAALRQATAARLLAHEDEKELLSNVRMSFAAKPVAPDGYVKDGDRLAVGASSLLVIHTPGHTAGSCCFYDEEHGILLSGDTLFHESVGRTDFPTGNHTALMDSIKTRLFTLPEDVRVLPGHNEETSLAHEKAHNPFVR